MNYRVQYERVIRWFERFKTINSGKMHTTSTENYEDEVHAFFQNCYHLKDWIKNDTSITRLLDVEEYINVAVSLQLCADICNALKHLSRIRPNRSGMAPEFGEAGGVSRSRDKWSGDKDHLLGRHQGWSYGCICTSNGLCSGVGLLHSNIHKSIEYGCKIYSY
jgi:hypothetical protein